MMVMTGLHQEFMKRHLLFFSALTRTTFRFEKLASSLKVSDDAGDEKVTETIFWKVDSRSDESRT